MDKKTGLVIPGRGVSLNSDPAALAKYGRVGAPVNMSSIPEGLEVIPHGNPGHYEIVVQQGVDMTPDQFNELTAGIKTC